MRCLILLALLLGSAMANVVKQPKEENKQDDSSLCSADALLDLQKKIIATEAPGIFSVTLERNQDPNNKVNCKWMVYALFYKDGYTQDTKLSVIMDDMKTARTAIWKGLKQAGVSEKMFPYFDILQSDKPEQEISSELHTRIDRISARSGLSRQQFTSTAQSRTAPTKVQAGQKTSICKEELNSDRIIYGTLGGIVLDDQGHAHAVSNNHVWTSTAGICVGKNEVGIVSDQVANTAIQDKDIFEFAAHKAPYKKYRELKGGNKPQGHDIASIQLPKDTGVDCRIDGKWVTGVRAGSTADKYAQDALDNNGLKVWKLGANSGVTKGKVVASFLDANGAFGYTIEGTDPQIPKRKEHRDPNHEETKCVGCWRPNGGKHRVSTAKEALKADLKTGTGVKWNTHIFTHPNDSGSWILDENNEVVCLHKQGYWVTNVNGVKVKRSDCLPFAHVLNVMETFNSPRTFKVCKQNDIKKGKAA